MYFLYAIGNHKDREEIERGLLDEARTCAEQDFGRTVSERLNDRSLGLALLLLDQREEWRLKDTHADIQTNNDEQRTQEERDAPAPGEESRASRPLDDVDYDGREH